MLYLFVQLERDRLAIQFHDNYDESVTSCLRMLDRHWSQDTPIPCLEYTRVLDTAQPSSASYVPIIVTPVLI